MTLHHILPNCISPVLSREAGSYPLPSDHCSAVHWLNSGLGKVGHYKTLLHTAIKLGGKEVVSLLLSAGARAGQHNEDLGLSPIHAAVREGHLAILSCSSPPRATAPR